MLTAVSDFVGDSFSTRDGLLEQLRAGDLNILLHRSGPLMLAGLITDPPPAALNERLQGMVEQVRRVTATWSMTNGTAAPAYWSACARS